MSTKVVAFDLDDTLYKEIDFVKSAYRYIANILSHKYPLLNYSNCLDLMLSADNAFDALFDYITTNNIKIDEDIKWCVNTYRNHMPDISLSTETTETLIKLQQQTIDMAIITDGRTNSQLNKIKALGLLQFIPIERIFISESIGHDKHTPHPFSLLMKQYPNNTKFYYIGDNPIKDFYWTNNLGWTTICLCDNGQNIHPQDLINCLPQYRPQITINNISEIINLI